MNVPKLRFSEFNNEWSQRKLGELCELKNGVNKSKSDFGFGIPFVNLLDVFNRNILYDNKSLGLVNASKKEKIEFNLNKGDILFVRSSVKTEGVGLTTLINNNLDNTVYSGFLIRARFFDDSLNNKYKRFYFYNPYFRKSLIKKSSKSANVNINQDNLSLLSINYPSVKEQNKIATMLSLLDKKIELQSKKIEDLKLYKICLKNKLFLDEENKVKLKYILNKWTKKNKDNRYNYVESISNKLGFIPQNEQFEDRNVASNDKANYYVIEKDVFAYNPSRLNVGSLALKQNDIISLVSPLYECFTTNQNKVFLYEWFDSKEFKKGTISKFEGGVRNTLNFNNLCEIEISLPSIEKQNTISEILTTFNNKINLEEEKLNRLNNLKKGLMQSMFV